MCDTRKTVVTITGIRPDFIRMSQVFKRLDESFYHILIHTGQHYDAQLSGVFFKELGIRAPDYTLNTGREASNHYEQLSYLSTAIPKLFKEHSIQPDLVLFLGDSNSAGVAFPLKKEGYRIGHIEAGMRSYDKRMLEEINRTVCDHCSDILFVYHPDYAAQLAQEGITKNVFVPEEYERSDIGRLWAEFTPSLERLRLAYENDSWPPMPTGLCGWCPVKTCEFNKKH